MLLYLLVPFPFFFSGVACFFAPRICPSSFRKQRATVFLFSPVQTVFVYQSSLTFFSCSPLYIFYLLFCARDGCHPFCVLLLSEKKMKLCLVSNVLLGGVFFQSFILVTFPSSLLLHDPTFELNPPFKSALFLPPPFILKLLSQSSTLIPVPTTVVRSFLSWALQQGRGLVCIWQNSENFQPPTYPLIDEFYFRANSGSPPPSSPILKRPIHLTILTRSSPIFKTPFFFYLVFPQYPPFFFCPVASPLPPSRQTLICGLFSHSSFSSPDGVMNASTLPPPPSPAAPQLLAFSIGPLLWFHS